MVEHARFDDRDRTSASRKTAATPSSASAPGRSGGQLPAQALALQRTVGNRATARVLSRWVAHPDKDKKGVLMPDEMAAEFVRFNPPLSK
jgi:hypothetical protein